MEMARGWGGGANRERSVKGSTLSALRPTMSGDLLQGTVTVADSAVLYH